MNKLLLQFCLVVIAVVGVVPSCNNIDTEAEESISVRKLGVDYDYVYCKAGEHAVDRHVPRRDFTKDPSKGGTLGDFQVNYTGFPPQAQAAFQYAVDIWDMLLDSDAKIIVNANFADLDSGILGSAAPTSMYSNFSDKVDEDIEYSAPLAEKILGASLNGAAADLSCNFSSAVNWYYDFNNPDAIGGSQYDFVSVVLHELGHGLGFLSRYTFASTGRLGFIRGSSPVLTDVFSLLLEDGARASLILDYEEASSELGEALTGGEVYFNSHLFIRDSGPELFAPNPWNSGSSLSHLDEATFNPTDPLMTPSIGSAEVHHDPEIALDMMNQMGWKSSFIAHRAENVEITSSPFQVVANVYTDEGIGFDSSSVLLVYSQDSFRVSSDTIVLSSLNKDSEFRTELPSTTTTGRYQYYFALNDTVNKGYSSPLLAPRMFHDIQVGFDNEAPNIVHTPALFVFINEGDPVISALVTDSFTGVGEVEMEYRINGGALTKSSLSLIELDQYELQLEVESFGAKVGDLIEYRLIATDQAMTLNTRLDPAIGFHSMEVRGVPLAVQYYENDFEGPNVDFVFHGFSFRSEPGFDGSGLHSEHPYKNGGSATNLNFTAQLRVPVKVIEDGMIEFDEVVLVEPGESGSSFGSDEFWDYVIVEASKNNGSSWVALADGYDSSSRGSWKSRYDAGLSGQNSSSAGDKGIISRRKIPLHQPALGINIGDEVQIRWRLFSDPFAVGWGWMIDSLVIQEVQNTTPVVAYDIADDYISIFPNPITNDNLNYSVVGDIAIRRTRIADSNGRLMYQSIDGATQNDAKQVDVSALTPGVYFIVFETDDLTITKRFLKL